MVVQLDLFTKRCGGCGRALPLIEQEPGRGRPRCYCNDACQQRAYRRRQMKKRNGARYENTTPFDLIYCAGGNPRLSSIALEEGWQLGFRSDKQLDNFPVTFIDVHYRNPDFEKHLRMVRKHRPKYATVPDLSEDQISEQDVSRALAQYAQLSPYCAIPLIVPKLSGQIAMLPAHIAIGYSIPTSYGGARYPLWELEGRRVHLLGGSPHQQMDLYRSLSLIATVVSADGNMAMKMATQFAKFWQQGAWLPDPERHMNRADLYLECWRRSCSNIRAAWERLTSLPRGGLK